MEYQNFIQTFFPASLKPWEHDYYVATFAETLGDQGFADYCFAEIAGLDGLWFRTMGSTAYFVVKKGTVIPEQFGISIVQVTQVPEEPVVVPE